MRVLLVRPNLNKKITTVKKIVWGIVKQLICLADVVLLTMNDLVCQAKI